MSLSTDPPAHHMVHGAFVFDRAVVVACPHLVHGVAGVSIVRTDPYAPPHLPLVIPKFVSQG